MQVSHPPFSTLLSSFSSKLGMSLTPATTWTTALPVSWSLAMAITVQNFDTQSTILTLQLVGIHSTAHVCKSLIWKVVLLLAEKQLEPVENF